MGKKEKKSKTAEQKARVAAKQSKKAAQKDKKIKAKGVDDSDGEDVDLESVLEEYAKKVRFSHYSERTIDNYVPSRIIYCTILIIALKSSSGNHNASIRATAFERCRI